MRRLIATLALLLSLGAAAQTPSEAPVILGGPAGTNPTVPILYVGTGAIQPPGGNFPSSLVVPVPSGVLSGDYMLAMIWQFDTGFLGAPSGWNLLTAVITPGNTPPQQVDQLSIYYKVAGGSEPANYTWTNGGNPAGGIRVYRNVSAITAVDNFASAANSIGTNASIPSMPNTALPNEIYVGFWDNPDNGNSLTVPTGFGNIVFTNNNINMYMADQTYPAKGSAIPVQTATLSGSTYWEAIGVLLRPLP